MVGIRLSLSPPPSPLSPHKVTVLLENGGSKRMESCRPNPIGLRSWHPQDYRAFSHILRSLDIAVESVRYSRFSSLFDGDFGIRGTHNENKQNNKPTFHRQ